jgi:hypothetical protein
MNNYKICTKCKLKKLKIDFCCDKQKKDNLSSSCKLCNKLRGIKWRKINKLKITKYHKKYYQNNLEKIKNYQQTHSKKRSAYMLKWRSKNKLHIKRYKHKYEAFRKLHNVEYRMLCNLRNRLRLALMSNSKFGKTTELIGCSISKLKNYIEKKFTKGMTWNNYGRNGWHIDHIKPCVKFDLSKKAEQKRCFHYTNLQPLWAVDNIIKGSKYYS